MLIAGGSLAAVSATLVVGCDSTRLVGPPCCNAGGPYPCCELYCTNTAAAESCTACRQEGGSYDVDSGVCAPGPLDAGANDDAHD